jgi:hypothetical protein
MDMNKCYICQSQLDFANHQIPMREFAIDEYENVGRLCPECNTELNEKVALVVEEKGMRTGEIVFLTRKVLNMVCPQTFHPNYHIYLVARVTIKETMKRILQLR